MLSQAITLFRSVLISSKSWLRLIDFTEILFPSLKNWWSISASTEGYNNIPSKLWFSDSSEFFEAITFFGEIVIRQIGFQVIAISLGRRGLGEWNPQDSIRFVVMLSTSIIATLICYAPFYAGTIFKLELLE